jgi:signal peptidase I
LSRCEVAAAENSPACLLQEVVQRFGSARIRVQGSSMLPSIRPGDEIEVQPIPFHEIETGDVIAYRRGDRLFAHRVIGKDPGNNNLITRGDSLPQADAPVLESELLGSVAAVFRNGERIDLNRSLVALAAGELFRRSGTCAALFVKFASL